MILDMEFPEHCVAIPVSFGEVVVVGTLEDIISASGITLTDRTTGKKYTLYIDNGKLTMEESEG